MHEAYRPAGSPHGSDRRKDVDLRQKRKAGGLSSPVQTEIPLAGRRIVMSRSASGMAEDRAIGECRRRACRGPLVNAGQSPILPVFMPYEALYLARCVLHEADLGRECRREEIVICVCIDRVIAVAGHLCGQMITFPPNDHRDGWVGISPRIIVEQVPGDWRRHVWLAFIIEALLQLLRNVRADTISPTVPAILMQDQCCCSTICRRKERQLGSCCCVEEFVVVIGKHWKRLAARSLHIDLVTVAGDGKNIGWR